MQAYNLPVVQHHTQSAYRIPLNGTISSEPNCLPSQCQHTLLAVASTDGRTRTTRRSSSRTWWTQSWRFVVSSVTDHKVHLPYLSEISERYMLSYALFANEYLYRSIINLRSISSLQLPSQRRKLSSAADSHIFNAGLHGVNNAEPLVPKPTSFGLKTATENLRRYTPPSTHQLHQKRPKKEVIHYILRSIKFSNSVWNMQKLPE
jgi:hypothetical protein